MKSALLHVQEPGRICDIVPLGQEFEVHSNFSWVEVPDDTTTADKWDTVNNVVIKFDITADPEFQANGYKVARGIGYKSMGDQLDLIFHELNTTGTISNTGPWASHIASIKAAIPKDDPAAVYAWNLAYLASLQGNT